MFQIFHPYVFIAISGCCIIFAMSFQVPPGDFFVGVPKVSYMCEQSPRVRGGAGV
jgi:hypothetical protein